MAKPTWSKIFKCHECEAENTVTVDDVHANESRVYYICTNCNSSVYITKKVPSGIKEWVWGIAASEASAWGM